MGLVLGRLSTVSALCLAALGCWVGFLLASPIDVGQDIFSPALACSFACAAFSGEAESCACDR